MNAKPFTYWPTYPTPQGYPRWAVGKYGPRYIIQADNEADIQAIVIALNQAETGTA